MEVAKEEELQTMKECWEVWWIRMTKERDACSKLTARREAVRCTKYEVECQGGTELLRCDPATTDRKKEECGSRRGEKRAIAGWPRGHHEQLRDSNKLKVSKRPMREGASRILGKSS